MNKIILFFCIIAACFICNPFAFSQSSQFSNTWLSPNINFKTYEAICIDEIDTNDIRVEVDYAGGKESERSDPDKIRSRIASELRSRFREILGLTLDVRAGKNDIAGRKALIVNVKLLGVVAAQSQLDALREISFKIEVLDAEGGEKAFELSNVYRLASKKENVSGSKADNLDEWSRAIDLWAIDFSIYLKHQINISN
jgi:hypothetical protein